MTFIGTYPTIELTSGTGSSCNWGWAKSRIIQSSSATCDTGATWLQVEDNNTCTGYSYLSGDTTSTITYDYDDWTCTGSAAATTVRFKLGRAGYTDSNGCSWVSVSYESRRKTPEEKLKEIIRGRCAPNIVTKRNALVLPADVREQRARETLKRVIGDKKFLNFLKSGFISVKAHSGLVYQIFPGHGFTQVYNQGVMVERLCVVLRGDFPPTDSLIMRYLLILNNEQHFRSCANKHSVPQQPNRILTGEAAMKPLAEIYKELKKVA